MSGTLQLDSLVDAMEERLVRVVDRATTGVVLQTAHAEAMMIRDLGPLCLDGHEVIILAALEWGDPWPAFVGLEARHFGCPTRGAAFRAMRALWAEGKPMDREVLREALEAQHPLRGTFAVDQLLSSIDRAPPVEAGVVRRLVVEVIEAAAWSDLVQDLRTIDRHLRVEARAALEQQHRPWSTMVAFDGRAALARLDALREALAAQIGAGP